MTVLPHCPFGKQATEALPPFAQNAEQVPSTGVPAQVAGKYPSVTMAVGTPEHLLGGAA